MKACERKQIASWGLAVAKVFSLMNDLKTAELPCQENLLNLMKWHTAGKGLSCQELPVIQILKEFASLPA